MPKYIDIKALYNCFINYPSVCTDSRHLRRGDIFVALKGPSFDGNDFALKALQEGASYAIVSRPELVNLNERCLLVEDTLVALQDLARMHRESMDIPVIAITGTNGKTTTKEIINAILCSKYHVLATEGNLNNHIGVPLTVLKMSRQHEVAVIEMGASSRGEINALCQIAKPTIGLITNIGKAHLEGFGTQEEILRTKSELFDYLKEHDGVYIINRDDVLLAHQWANTDSITYGLSEHSDCRIYIGGRVIKKNAPFLSMEIFADQKIVSIDTHLIGDYNASNLLAAIAVGLSLRVDLEEVVRALENYIPSNNRSQLIAMERDIKMIMDCYNANPSSMFAALNNLNSLKAPYKLAILGDMLELGYESTREHMNILEWLRGHPSITAILVGKEFSRACQAKCFDEWSGGVMHYESVEDLKKHLLTIELPNGAIVLLKGSRGISLEKCESWLKASFAV